MMKTQKSKFVGAFFSLEEHGALLAEAKAAGRTMRAHLRWKTREALLQAGLLPTPRPARKTRGALRSCPPPPSPSEGSPGL